MIYLIMKTDQMPSLEATATNQTTMLRLYDEVLNQRKFEVIDELFAPDLYNHSTRERGRESLHAAVRMLHEAFQGLHYAVEEMFADGDLVIVVWKMSARHVGAFKGIEPSGNLIENQALVVAKFKEGWISEMWVQVSGLRQLPEGE